MRLNRQWRLILELNKREDKSVVVIVGIKKITTEDLSHGYYTTHASGSVPSPESLFGRNWKREAGRRPTWRRSLISRFRQSTRSSPGKRRLRRKRLTRSVMRLVLDLNSG